MLPQKPSEINSEDGNSASARGVAGQTVCLVRVPTRLPSNKPSTHGVLIVGADYLDLVGAACAARQGRLRMTVVNDLTSGFLLVYAGLFPIINPIGGAPIFLGLTQSYTELEQHGLALRVALNSF